MKLYSSDSVITEALTPQGADGGGCVVVSAVAAVLVAVVIGAAVASKPGSGKEGALLF